MTFNYCAVLIILVFRLQDHVFVEAQFEGSTCKLSNSWGICRQIDRCQSVYDDLLSGRRPEVVCGYSGNNPIVCCPTGSTTMISTTTSRPIWGTITTPPQRNPFANSRPARRMCAEYAKTVYTLVEPPVLAGGSQQLVNVSLCAIKSKKLIVGGTKAEPKEFPHMASLGYIVGQTIRWNCGATVISDKYVLTAAHCTFDWNWGSVEWVRVGDLNLANAYDDAKPQNHRVVDRIRHPNYRRPPQYDDIALVKIETQFTFNAYVRPACLSLAASQPAGEKAVATGWGNVDWYDEKGSDNLLKVTLPIVSFSKCHTAFNDDISRLPSGINDTSQLCAGEENKDTCQGDSGGPLVVFSNDEECMYDIIGVTSFGKFCGSVAPGVYTRVSAYVSWIESIVWPTTG